jgi:uncharacterized membrane protein YjjP (DUF1212 family)
VSVYNSFIVLIVPGMALFSASNETSRRVNMVAAKRMLKKPQASSI